MSKPESLTIEEIIEDYDYKGLSSPTESRLMESLTYHQEHLLKLWLEERVEINNFYCDTKLQSEA